MFHQVSTGEHFVLIGGIIGYESNPSLSICTLHDDVLGRLFIDVKRLQNQSLSTHLLRCHEPNQVTSIMSAE